MENHRFYLSTIAADAAGTARQYALGLEIAEYCTACNMDEHFPETDAAVREKIAGIARVTLHAPFNELFPCAIDPRARALAAPLPRGDRPCKGLRRGKDRHPRRL